MTVEFYARPAGTRQFKKYTKSVVINAPDGSSRDLLKLLAQERMPRQVDRLISNRDWSDVTIAKGPITKPRRKKVRVRR